MKTISHLLFADDMLVFCRADKSSIKELNKIFDKLSFNTGLQVNREKSRAFFSKSCKHKYDLVAVLRISISSLPTKHLGLPSSISYIKARHFAPLIDKCRKKLEGRMLKKLSFAWREELIKIILQNSLSYWAFSFKLPSSIIRELERIFSGFHWHQKMHSWSWMNYVKQRRRVVWDSED